MSMGPVLVPANDGLQEIEEFVWRFELGRVSGVDLNGMNADGTEGGPSSGTSPGSASGLR